MNLSQSHGIDANDSVDLQARSIRLPGAGSGYCLGSRGAFDPETIGSWLARPDRLLEDGGQVLKTDRGTLVVRRSFVWEGRATDCVVKYQRYDRRPTDRLRGFFPLRAVACFRMAIRLLKAGLPVPRPLLAVEKRGGFSIPQSLLITEYIPDSIHLYGFLQNGLHSSNPCFAGIKRSLALQVASIFHRLDRLGLRHRDAKPSNWLVQPVSDKPRLWLIDLDGIRSKGLARDADLDGLAQLASKLMWSPILYRTDYLRAFRSYFASARPVDQEWKGCFRRVARLAVARRVMSLAETILRQPVHLRQGQPHA